MAIEKVCRAHCLADFFISLSHKPKFDNMKRPFITSLFLILALTSMAQASKNYITPDWKQIEQLCASRPDSIRLLVERVATPTPEQPHGGMRAGLLRSELYQPWKGNRQ